MKAAWIAPIILTLAATPALAVETSSNVQQQSQTQGNVSPNAINPGQGKQPDGHTTGGGNQQHTDDFGSPKVDDADGATDLNTDKNADTEESADHGTDNDDKGDNGASASRGSSADIGASADQVSD